MNNEMKEKAFRSIKEFKKIFYREPYSEEINTIIERCGGCSFFQKLSIIKEAQKGIDNVHDLYEMYKDYKDDVNIDEEKALFLISSINATENTLKAKQREFDRTNNPKDDALSAFAFSKMQFLYIKDLYGFSIDNEKRFIKNHQDLYKLIFKPEEKGQDITKIKSLRI